eukprot:SAG31_NODE_25036_length_469_cov_0.970270_1_plen_47_part_10
MGLIEKVPVTLQGSLTGKKFNTGSRPCLRNYTCAQFCAPGTAFPLTP